MRKEAKMLKTFMAFIAIVLFMALCTQLICRALYITAYQDALSVVAKRDAKAGW